jgi:hypothetical protein
MMQNITTQANTSFLFEEIYKFNWSMGLGILASVINVMFVTPVALAIIWYERYGSNQKRTLLNQVPMLSTILVW